VIRKIYKLAQAATNIVLLSLSPLEITAGKAATNSLPCDPQQRQLCCDESNGKQRSSLRSHRTDGSAHSKQRQTPVVVPQAPQPSDAEARSCDGGNRKKLFVVVTSTTSTPRRIAQ